MRKAAQASIRRLLVWVAARRGGGIDLTRWDNVPDALAWPLHRDGMDPPARLAEVRATDPIHKLTSFMGMNVWLVTGHDLAREVLGDMSSYSTDIRPYVGKSGAVGGDIGGLGFTDPPEHTKFRKLLTPEFTMRRLERIRPMVTRIVDRQLDQIARQAEETEIVDLVPTFAFAVPFLVICELLGLPDERREIFRKLGSARFDVTKGGAAFGAISGSREFLLAEAVRQRNDPGPGLIGQIVRDHGDEIGDHDLGGLADGVFTGGMETSAGMLALGTAVLLDKPEWWQRLQTDEAPVDPIVEELLRYLSVVQVAFPRFAKQDVVVGGVAGRQGRRRACLATGSQSRRRVRRRSRVVRPDSPDAAASRVRLRAAPLCRGRAGPDGTARCLPRARPTLPRDAPRRAGHPLQRQLDRLRSRLPARQARD